MIRNIILDIGDVLVKSNWREFFAARGYPGEAGEALAKATFFTPVWHDLDTGRFTFDEITEAFVRRTPALESALRTVFTDMHGFVTVFPYARSWIRGFHTQGLKVFCLSNWSEKAYEGTADQLTFLEETDGYVLSWQEKTAKPEPRIYEILLSRYDLKANECVFVDDNPENVRAAEAFGIHGVVFRDREQADREVRRIMREEACRD